MKGKPKGNRRFRFESVQQHSSSSSSRIKSAANPFVQTTKNKEYVAFNPTGFWRVPSLATDCVIVRPCRATHGKDIKPSRLFVCMCVCHRLLLVAKENDNSPNFRLNTKNENKSRPQREKYKIKILLDIKLCQRTKGSTGAKPQLFSFRMRNS